jgi:hypothetical protein
VHHTSRLEVFILNNVPKNVLQFFDSITPYLLLLFSKNIAQGGLELAV